MKREQWQTMEQRREEKRRNDKDWIESEIIDHQRALVDNTPNRECTSAVWSLAMNKRMSLSNQRRNPEVFVGYFRWFIQENWSLNEKRCLLWLKKSKAKMSIICLEKYLRVLLGSSVSRRDFCCWHVIDVCLDNCRRDLWWWKEHTNLVDNEWCSNSEVRQEHLLS